MVNIPGQNRSTNAWPASLSPAVTPLTVCRLPIKTGSGQVRSRPFTCRMRSNPSLRNASVATAYADSVARTTSSPCRDAATAASIPAANCAGSRVSK